MNYLGHLYFSGTDPELQIGGLLGDFVKGPLRGRFPAGIEAGIRRHREIDALCDELAPIQTLIASFDPPWRRYAAIAVDVAFDHRLARDWTRYHSQPLPEFCQSFYRALASHRALLPERARLFCDHAPRQQLLEHYGEAEHMRLVLARIGRRLRRPVALEQLWEMLADRSQAVTDAFRHTMAAATLRCGLHLDAGGRL